MKTKIFAVALLSMAISAATINQTLAQRPQGAKQEQVKNNKKADKTPEARAKAIADRMAKQLELTDAQAQQMYQVQLKAIKERQELAKQMKALRDEQTKQMLSILDDDQTAKYVDNLKNKKGPKGGKKAKMNKQKRGGNKSNKANRANKANTPRGTKTATLELQDIK